MTEFLNLGVNVMYTSEFWKKFLSDNYHLVLEQAKKEYRGDKMAVEDACSYVYDKLIEDDCRRLCNYNGKASEKTYFCTLIRYRIMDFRRDKYKHREEHPENDPDLTNQPDPTSPSPINQIIWKQIKILIASILQKNPNEESTIYPASEKLKRLTQKIKNEFKATDEERLFLRMIYQDGMKVTVAGRKLGWNRNQSHGRHRRLMERLRKVIPKDILQELISCFNN
jgi:RNA polymerase sigma factor (sigma-70 family)